jgi:hypothetical protein
LAASGTREWDWEALWSISRSRRSRVPSGVSCQSRGEQSTSLHVPNIRCRGVIDEMSKVSRAAVQVRVLQGTDEDQHSRGSPDVQDLQFHRLALSHA